MRVLTSTEGCGCFAAWSAGICSQRMHRSNTIQQSPVEKEPEAERAGGEVGCEPRALCIMGIVVHLARPAMAAPEAGLPFPVDPASESGKTPLRLEQIKSKERNCRLSKILLRRHNRWGSWSRWCAQARRAAAAARTGEQTGHWNRRTEAR